MDFSSRTCARNSYALRKRPLAAAAPVRLDDHHWATAIVAPGTAALVAFTHELAG